MHGWGDIIVMVTAGHISLYGSFDTFCRKTRLRNET